MMMRDYDDTIDREDTYIALDAIETMAIQICLVKGVDVQDSAQAIARLAGRWKEKFRHSHACSWDNCQMCGVETCWCASKSVSLFNCNNEEKSRMFICRDCAIHAYKRIKKVLVFREDA